MLKNTALYTNIAAHDKILTFDREGAITDRKDLDTLKKPFAIKTATKQVAEAMKGPDVFIGVITGNIVSQEMVKSMAASPIVFVMANPDLEITYEASTEAHPDVIMATGRSGFPNQVNNILGIPIHPSWCAGRTRYQHQ